MAERLTRDRIIDEIRRLAADATLRDVIGHLVFVAKIDEGSPSSMPAGASRTTRRSVGWASERHS